MFVISTTSTVHYYNHDIIVNDAGWYFQSSRNSYNRLNTMTDKVYVTIMVLNIIQTNIYINNIFVFNIINIVLIINT